MMLLLSFLFEMEPETLSVTILSPFLDSVLKSKFEYVSTLRRCSRLRGSNRLNADGLLTSRCSRFPRNLTK